jgi:hypothetical protein
MTPAFFKKNGKIFLQANLWLFLEEKMKNLWVEMKKRGLKMVDFMLILEY